MKRISFLLAAGIALAGLTGCGHVDLTPEGDPNRVVTGTVNVRMNLIPPSDAVVVVRLVQPPDVANVSSAPMSDMVIGERGPQARPENVVGEQVIHAPAAVPVPFRVECQASDALLRRGLNIEARISWGGKVRFRTVESQVVTLATVASPQAVWVEAVR
jgi:uncharacterized lipoprotein YbaY